MNLQKIFLKSAPQPRSELDQITNCKYEDESQVGTLTH